MTNRRPKLYDTVKLLIDIPEENLSAGASGAIVFDYCEDDAPFEVEFPGPDGTPLSESITVALTKDKFEIAKSTGD